VTEKNEARLRRGRAGFKRDDEDESTERPE
jgi:hypothetical protein